MAQVGLSKANKVKAVLFSAFKGLGAVGLAFLVAKPLLQKDPAEDAQQIRQQILDGWEGKIEKGLSFKKLQGPVTTEDVQVAQAFKQCLKDHYAAPATAYEVSKRKANIFNDFGKQAAGHYVESQKALSLCVEQAPAMRNVTTLKQF